MFSYTEEQKDYRQTLLLNLYRQSSLIFLHVIMIITLIISIVLIVIDAVESKPLDYTYIVYIGIILFISAFFPLTLILTAKMKWDSSINLPKEFSWVVTKEQVIVNRPFGQLVFQWDNFHKIVEYKNYFCFHLNIPEYFAIPKKVLSDEQITQLTGLIISSVNHSKVRVNLKMKSIKRKQ